MKNFVKRLRCSPPKINIFQITLTKIMFINRVRVVTIVLKAINVIALCTIVLDFVSLN